MIDWHIFDMKNFLRESTQHDTCMGFNGKNKTVTVFLSYVCIGLIGYKACDHVFRKLKKEKLYKYTVTKKHPHQKALK